MNKTRASANQVIRDPRKEAHHTINYDNCVTGAYGVFSEVLFKEGIQSLPDGANANELAVADFRGRPALARLDVRVRHDAPQKSHLRGFTHAQGRLRDAA